MTCVSPICGRTAAAASYPAMPCCARIDGRSFGECSVSMSSQSKSAVAAISAAMAVPCVSQQPNCLPPFPRDFLNHSPALPCHTLLGKPFAETRLFKIDPHAAEITIIGEEAVTVAGFSIGRMKLPDSTTSPARSPSP